MNAIVRAGRKFFYAFESNAPGPGYTAQIKHDEPLTPSQLRALPKVIYKRELEGRWLDASLTEILEEFERRRAGGNLPPENMVPPPKAKEARQVKLGHRERRVSSAEVAERARRRANERGPPAE